jgi:hypothetical protein
MFPHPRPSLPRTPRHAARASAAAARSTGAPAYVHEEVYITFRCQNQPLAPVYIEEFAMNSIVNGVSASTSSAVHTSAAARRYSNSSAANPRSGFVAHSHTLACYTSTRVNAPPHVHTHAARPDKQLFISSIEQFRPQKWPLATVFIEEFAMNSIVINTSGIFTGDEGFQLNVKGDVNLQGGQITSTDKAIQDGKNIYNVGGNTTTIDLQNNAQYSASASSSTVGIGTERGKTGGGIGNASGQASSVTLAGVSGQAGHTDVRTGDKSAAIAPIFDLGSVKQDIDAQVQITKAFTSTAIPAASRYADNQALDLRKQADAAGINTPEGQRLSQEAAKWDETGDYRKAIYAGIGALTGGLSGAAASVAGQTVIPVIGEEIAGLNLPEPVRQGLTLITSAAVGTLVGGAQGVAVTVPQTAHNYISHSPYANVRLTVSQENARLLNQCGNNCTLADMRNIDLQMQKLEAAGNLIETGQRSKLTTQQAVLLGENIASLLPIYGTPIALYQAITGKGIASEADLTAAERLFNTVAAAIPLANASYQIVKSAATTMSDLSTSFRAIGTAGSNQSVWKLEPYSRGNVIEQVLGQNLPQNMPVIDKFLNGTATSIKSVDLTAPTYQSVSGLNGKLLEYVDSIAKYIGTGPSGHAGFRILEKEIAARELTIAIPNTGNLAQQTIMQTVIQYGASKGVKVNYIVFP